MGAFMYTQRVGKFGEDLAVRYLRSKGYRILDRNSHFREGEIDIVARDGLELVFVEVKCRTSTAFGAPEESVNRTKLKRLRSAVFCYLSLQRAPNAWRIDLLAIEVKRARKTARIRHLKNI